MTNVYTQEDLNCDKFVTDVLTFDLPRSQKFYKKQVKSDKNTEYTIRYKTSVMTPNFTKILLNPNKEILAYIDVQRVPAPFKSQFKQWKWFGIQEFHPELIGDFSHLVTEEENGSFAGDCWLHKSNEHLYILDTSGLSHHQDWYRVGTDLINEGFIETNFGVLDGTTRSYRYNTHPSEPTQQIENLKNAILIKEGIIKPKLTFAQKVKAFIQRKR